MSLKKVIASIKKNKVFVITAHTNLEGDALGSELAFYRLIRKMGKQAIIINQDNFPSNYSFLPKVDIIKKYKAIKEDIRFDCLVVLDCSDLNRTGEVYRINKENKPVINIDHHISNQKFGKVNWIDASCSSCSEMIYRLYRGLRIPIDKEIATYLYVGILTDTGSFHYPNTNSFVHKVVSELLKFNLDVPFIYKNVYERLTPDDIKLIGKILPSMQSEAEGRIVWFKVKRSMLRNKKISFDLSEQILSFGRAIKDVDVVVLFKENLKVKDEIRVNFRSQGRLDVNKIAQFFGGGGHKTASGATIKGRLDQVERKVLAAIRKHL